MAYNRKSRARTDLVKDSVSPSVTNFSADEGLRFVLRIGDYRVSLSHLERDDIVARWAAQQKEHEQCF